MARVLLEHVNKCFGNVFAVKDVSLEIEDQEFLVLLGPSGCGKTTTLRLIAGLEELTSGNIYIGKRLVNDVPPKDRDIAMVFQSYALYPHMSVYDNLAFGLKIRHLPKKEIDERVQEVAEILELQDLIQRLPKQLSGGQKQRVALGRAIVRHPAVFLMDEPLSNLDAKLRVQMRAELQRLHERLKATIIYVTHDQVEAMTLGKRIAIILNGELQQVDRPLTVYEKPVNRFVASFIGSPPMNFVKGILRDGYFEAESFKIAIPEDLKSLLVDYIEKEVVFGIRPEDIWEEDYSKWMEETSKARIESVVEFRELMGSDTYLYSRVGKTPLVARVGSLTDVPAGSRFTLVLNMRKMHIFDVTTQKAII